MKKSYKLKEGIKTALIIGAIYLLFVGYLLIVSNRFERIENGDLILVNQNAE